MTVVDAERSFLTTAGTSHPGGKRAYRVAFGKDRTPRQSRRSIARAEYAQRPSQTIAQRLTALDPCEWLRRSSVARRPYCNFCAAQAEARPRRVGGRTVRLWKDSRGSLRPRPRM